MSLCDDAIRVIQTSDFREFWPIEVRKDLVRAAQHNSGIPLPPYAVRRVERALRVARGIERRMARDIEAGEALLSHAQRRALVGAK